MSSISSTPPDQKEGFFLLSGERDFITRSRCGSQEKEEDIKKKDVKGKEEAVKKKDVLEKKERPEKRGSFFKKGLLSESRFSHFISPLSLQKSSGSTEKVFAFSPRVKPEDIDASVQLIKKNLIFFCPAPLFQVLGQIIHNQYAFLSSDSHVLTISLEKAGMLKPFLSSIAQLIVPTSPLDPISIRRLIEVGLRIIGHPRTQTLIDSGELKQQIDSILSARAQNPKSPKFQELINKAKEATILRRISRSPSEELAKEGLCYLVPLIQNAKDENKFQKIKGSYENDPFAQQKTFLFLTYAFLFKKNHLHFDQTQKEHLIQSSLHIFLSSEGTSLLHLLKIKKIAELMLAPNLLEAPCLETRQLMQWTKGQLESPLIPLRSYRSSQDLAEKGLSSLSRYIHEPQDREDFQKIKDLYEHSPFSTQITFLFSVYSFLIEKNHLRLNELQKESIVQMISGVLLSDEGEQILHVLEIKKIAEQILSIHFNGYECEETKPLIQQAKIQVQTPLISLKEMQFLLFWIQAPLSQIEELPDLIAGTREWDPHGKLYLFVLTRCLDLMKELDIEPDALGRLIHFASCWRQAPANQDLLEKQPFFSIWEKFKDKLKKKKDLQATLGPELFLKIDQSEIGKQISLANVDVHEPAFSQNYLSSSLPLVIHRMWGEESIVKNLRDSIVFYFLLPKQQMTVEDLAMHGKIETKAISDQAKHFNQVTQFLVEQLLACNSISEFKEIVNILCCLQKELLEHSAFEAALAVHAVFAQASIARLEPILIKDDPFFKLYKELFKDPTALCNPQKNSIKLRELQEQNINSLNVLSLLCKDLIHLRENPFEFTEEGKINIDRLLHFGKFYNHFAENKLASLAYWIDHMHIAPDPSILRILRSQSGQNNDELWWERSQKIHPKGSDDYFIREAFQFAGEVEEW